MISIRAASIDDCALITAIGKQTFLESHGHSASPADINAYINEKYTPEAIGSELSNTSNHYHILFYDNQPAGYSNIVLNSTHSNISLSPATKLDRIYILQEFFHLKLGSFLLDYNIQVAKENDQQGMWLYVWTENHRAFRFYTKNKFTIIGGYDFRISATHTNPNHLMWRLL
jgi:ribosomal protein S18 acetylase RimI-like enzyme